MSLFSPWWRSVDAMWTVCPGISFSRSANRRLGTALILRPSPLVPSGAARPFTPKAPIPESGLPSIGSVRLEALREQIHDNPGYRRRRLYRQPNGSRPRRVVVLDNLSTGFKWAVPRGVAFVIGETGDDALVSRLIVEHELSSIIHFAA